MAAAVAAAASDLSKQKETDLSQQNKANNMHLMHREWNATKSSALPDYYEICRSDLIPIV